MWWAPISAEGRSGQRKIPQRDDVSLEHLKMIGNELSNCTLMFSVVVESIGLGSEAGLPGCESWVGIPNPSLAV